MPSAADRLISSPLLFQHGGQETTALTTIPFFAHQGIIFVPIGFARKELSTETHVVGGSAYGASSVACVTVCYLSQAPTVSLANSHLMIHQRRHWRACRP